MPASSDAASRRRQTRLRREYIYRKSLEGREKAAYEQKRVIREALAAGKPLPTEVRASYDQLRAQVDAEDIATESPKTHIDNEYGDAGLLEPKVGQRGREAGLSMVSFLKPISFFVVVFTGMRDDFA